MKCCCSPPLYYTHKKTMLLDKYFCSEQTETINQNKVKYKERLTYLWEENAQHVQY